MNRNGSSLAAKALAPQRAIAFDKDSSRDAEAGAPLSRAVIVWAVVDRDGDVVGAYTNRLSAARRCDYLDADSGRTGTYGPYGMARCEGKSDAHGSRAPREAGKP